MKYHIGVYTNSCEVNFLFLFFLFFGGRHHQSTVTLNVYETEIEL